MARGTPPVSSDDIPLSEGDRLNLSPPRKVSAKLTEEVDVGVNRRSKQRRCNMPNISLPAIIIIAIFAVITLSVIFNWRKRAALKPNLAAIRHGNRSRDSGGA